MFDRIVIDILQESVYKFKRKMNSLKNKHIQSNDSVLLKHWSAPEHPIKNLNINKRKLYLSGLGAALYGINNDDRIVPVLFSIWAKSIIGDNGQYQSLYSKGDKAIIRKAINAERKWLRPFKLSYSFVFDYYYLTCYDNKSMLNASRDYLLSVCSRRQRKAVLNVYDSFELDIIRKSRKLDEYLCSLYENSALSSELEYKKVLFVANVSAGKSTLINAISGRSYCQSSNLPCTSSIHHIYNKENAIETIYAKDGKYGDMHKPRKFEFDSISFSFQSSLCDVPICLIDTPGLNNSEDIKHSTKTYSVIEKNDYDLLLYISNAKYFDTSDERIALSTILTKCKKPFLFALNQLDSFDPEQDSISEMLEKYRKMLVEIGFRKPNIIPVSGYAKLLLDKPDSELGETDILNKKYFEQIFSMPYFDLPSYLKVEMKDKTGVNLLECNIIKQLS